MKSIAKGVRIIKGGLGIVIKGQKGKWNGSLPPTRETGDISTFSPASRRRLRETLAMAIGRPWGITLTIPGDVLSADKVRGLWYEWVNHTYPRTTSNPLIWRIELQRRKQAHWHCVMLAPDGADTTESVVSVLAVAQAWRNLVYRFCGPFTERTTYGFELHGVQYVDLTNSTATGIIGYLCDHTSKHKQEQLGWIGRQWGVINRRLLRSGGELLLTVSEREHIQASRQYRRLQERLRARGGAYTGVRVTPSGNVNTAVFGRDEGRLLRCYEAAMDTRAATDTRSR